MTSENPAVVILGSFMTDVTSYVKRLPKPGETISGHKLAICCGGKGANQCVTAARLGAAASIIGKLGDDSFGHIYLEALKKENINASHVSMTTEALTGVAQIIVDDNGQNSIVIVAGANDHLSPKDVERSRPLLSKAKVMLCVLEIPRETALAGLRLANELNIPVIFNAAPAVLDLEPEFYSLSDIFCVNETEAELLTGLPVKSREEAVVAAGRLLERGCKVAVLLTLGRQGAMFVGRKCPEPIFVEAPKAQAVDTTGAGDCFLGALAYFMVYHPDLCLEKAVERSCAVASISVQKSGTQPSFPYRDQVDAVLFQ